MKKNHLAFWEEENLNDPLLTEIKVVDDIEKHSAHATKTTDGNVRYVYVPIHAAYNAQELVTRLYNLVNAANNMLEEVGDPDLELRRDEAEETLKKVIE